MDVVHLECLAAKDEDSANIIELNLPITATFDDYLHMFSSTFQINTTSFYYRDDDGDNILVESQRDIPPMLHYYRIQRSLGYAGLAVFPSAARKKNVFGLTVAVADTPPAPTQPTPLQTAIQEAPSQLRDEDIALVNMLGHGASGTVYRGLHQPTQTILAVKVIAVEATAEMQRSIINELDILRKCSSPFIINYYGAFFSENRIKICTEFMDGGSLDQYGIIAEPFIGAIVAHVLQGLAYLRSLKVMHRDIKPSNMLANSAGVVKLCDFGVSTQLDQSITRTYVGTCAYMAPERIMGQPYTSASEVWSLGIAIAELALGQHPYGSRDMAPIELMQRIANEPPPAMPAGILGPDCVDFLARCLTKAAECRPTIDALASHAFVQRFQRVDLQPLVRAHLARSGR